MAGSTLISPVQVLTTRQTSKAVGINDTNYSHAKASTITIANSMNVSPTWPEYVLILSRLKLAVHQESGQHAIVL